MKHFLIILSFLTASAAGGNPCKPNACVPDGLQYHYVASDCVVQGTSLYAGQQGTLQFWAGKVHSRPNVPGIDTGRFSVQVDGTEVWGSAVDEVAEQPVQGYSAPFPAWRMVSVEVTVGSAIGMCSIVGEGGLAGWKSYDDVRLFVGGFDIIVNGSFEVPAVPGPGYDGGIFGQPAAAWTCVHCGMQMPTPQDAPLLIAHALDVVPPVGGEILQPEAVSIVLFEDDLPAVQDDPNAPDGEWMDGLNENSGSLAKATFDFPTPAVPLVGEQFFRVLARPSAGGTPLLTGALYDGGTFRGYVARDVPVTAETVIDMPFSSTGGWDGNSGAGARLEIRVKSDGGASVDLGAVEWVASTQ